MKKVLYVSLIALATLSLPSCGGENKTEAVETTTETPSDTAVLEEAPATTPADTAATTAPADTAAKQ
jgi:hypothetical protein